MVKKGSGVGTSKFIEKRILVTDLDPISLLKVRSAQEYEDIVDDWQREYLSKKYLKVEKLAGTGDKGRDVVCTLKNGQWINYQCKHYNRKLKKSDALPEIEKFCRNCYEGSFTQPNKYYFVSPFGVSVALRDFLQNKEQIKKDVLGCVHRDKRVDPKLVKYLEKFDFSIFDYIVPKDFLEQFKGTPQYTKWFGVLKKPRPILTKAPEEIRKIEMIYIKKVLDAYGDYLNKKIKINDLKKYPKLEENFKRQRLYFYSAEFLKAYSRETFDPEFQYFEKFKEEVYHSIVDEIESDADNGFERLKRILKLAAELNILNNELSSEIGVKDKKGICHHLANEKKEIKWIK